MIDVNNINDSRLPGDSQQQDELEGTLERINWSSPHGDFVVARFRVEGELFPVIAVGEMYSPTCGDEYLLTGNWDEHPKYGRRFRFTAYQTKYPESREGVLQYLASGLIKGIGITLATRIVKRFGTDAIRIMNEDIDRLLEIEGIGEKKLEIIRGAWDRLRGVQHVMLFLKQHGISTTFAVRIYRTYGTQAVESIRNNPYRLLHDVDGIGFKAADRIALSIGVEPDDHRRLLAGSIYALREAARRDGHCCLPAELFAQHTAALLGTHSGQMFSAIRQAVEQGHVIEEDEYLYLPELYEAEQRVADEFRAAFAEVWNGLDHLVIGDLLTRVEKRRGVRFNAQQVEAVHKCLGGPACILTGGPGTGKTTALAGIIDVAVLLGIDVAVCAPTGRAARRIQELTGAHAKTIHRLLEFDPPSGRFGRDESNPLEAGLLIVDEMSMVDVPLFAALMRARPTGCRLALIGDADQLPSVGPGSVLRDLLASGCIDSVMLKLIFRQATNSSIVTNAHRVRDGFMPVFDTRRTDSGQTFFREVGSDENIASLVRDLVAERIPRELDCDSMHDIQVLSPMYNTSAGVNNLNALLQRALNGGSRVVLRRGERVFHLGDKVMQIRNNYEKDVYNGDIGFIRGYDEEEQQLRVQFDARSVDIAIEDVDDLVLAYAVTIHKSQGSEYDVVVIPLVMQHRIMLRRNLLYTAMTRARRMLVLLGQRQALSVALRTVRQQERFSRLRERVLSALR